MQAAVALIDIDWGRMVFQGWNDVVRTLIIGTAAYVGLVVFLRVSGNRTLSKFNSFDFVVTIAFGSILATLLLNEDVALAEGLAAIALLVGLQAVVTWSSVRWPQVQRMVKGTPRLLYHGGTWRDDELQRTRVTREEVHAAVRKSGLASMDEVALVVLETEGTISVVRRGEIRGSVVLEAVVPSPPEED